MNLLTLQLTDKHKMNYKLFGAKLSVTYKNNETEINFSSIV